MQFSSAIFLMLFLPSVMLLYWIWGGGEKHREYKNIILLLASIIFYAWGEPVFVFVMLGSICLNYILGLLIEKKQLYKKIILIVSLIFNLGILVVFKYLTFIIRNLQVFLDIPGVDIALPIGISFYTFQIMSYIFDVYYGKAKAQHKILHLALYIAVFPQLIAGPIVRYNTIEQEIVARRETLSDFSDGITRFVMGLSKKVLLADFLAGIADSIFTTAQYEQIFPLTAWIGAVAYTLEIYYDFSGYSDMAIGLGRCFGFHFQENFNYPYTSRSITEFWKRWHISLTNWFREYVYIPLGGNRVPTYRHIFNLLVVWLLTGIWHGAEWTFIVWGLIYFIFQTIEKYVGFADRLPKIVGWIYTMVVVILCWVLFKAENLSLGIKYLQNLFSFHNGIYNMESLSYAKSSYFVMIISFLGCFPIIPKIRAFCTSRKSMSMGYEIGRTIMTVVLLVVSLLVVISGSYSPFIYFNF